MHVPTHPAASGTDSLTAETYNLLVCTRCSELCFGKSSVNDGRASWMENSVGESITICW